MQSEERPAPRRDVNDLRAAALGDQVMGGQMIGYDLGHQVVSGGIQVTVAGVVKGPRWGFLADCFLGGNENNRLVPAK